MMLVVAANDIMVCVIRYRKGHQPIRVTWWEITVWCHVISCHVISCHVMSCHVMSCHVMSCHVMSYHVMSCHVMSCYVMLCHVTSCLRNGMFYALLSVIATSVLAREIFGICQIAALESIMRRWMRCKNRWWIRAFCQSIILFSHILIAQQVLLFYVSFILGISDWLAYR